MLKLSARIWNRNPKHAWIQIFQNGGYTGSLLCVDAEHADKLVALLNAATELLEGLEYCLRFVPNEKWTSRLRDLVVKAKGTT